MKRNNMQEFIEQHLLVKEWPLVKIGDEKFFGYIVALGVFPREWADDDGMFHYVDFAYNDDYERYKLPQDEGLKKQLHAMLWHNLNGHSSPADIYGKVWIKRIKNGHVVELP